MRGNIKGIGPKREIRREMSIGVELEGEMEVVTSQP
jgi:hypothetical protein